MTGVGTSLPRLRRIAGPGVLAVVLVTLGTPRAPVSALEDPGLRIEPNQTIEQEYKPIVGQNPVPTNPLQKPDDCRKAIYCQVIPLQIVVPPNTDDSVDFVIRGELSWETQTIPATPATGSSAVNDMDLYVWDDPQGTEPLAAGATQKQPESLRLFRPTKGHYQLVVVNYVGPNTGYRLKLSYTTERLVPPFESLDPSFQPPATPVEAPPAAPPVDLSDVPAAPPEKDKFVHPPAPPPPAPAPEPVAAPAPLAPVPVEPDPDYTNFSDSKFDESLAAPAQTDVLQEKQARVTGPAPPASAGSLVFWLAVVPLLLAAGAGFWLTRRGSAVLRFK